MASPIPWPNWATQWTIPYTIIHENTRNTVDDRILGNFSGAYQISNDLTFNSTLGRVGQQRQNGQVFILPDHQPPKERGMPGWMPARIPPLSRKII
jgi:hypothetical protein